jgi:hypothetical protein
MGAAEWPPLRLLTSVPLVIWHRLSDLKLEAASSDCNSFRLCRGLYRTRAATERTAFTGFRARRLMDRLVFGAGSGQLKAKGGTSRMSSLVHATPIPSANIRQDGWAGHGHRITGQGLKAHITAAQEQYSSSGGSHPHQSASRAAAGRDAGQRRDAGASHSSRHFPAAVIGGGRICIAS